MSFYLLAGDTVSAPQSPPAPAGTFAPGAGLRVATPSFRLPRPRVRLVCGGPAEVLVETEDATLAVRPKVAGALRLRAAHAPEIRVEPSAPTVRARPTVRPVVLAAPAPAELAVEVGDGDLVVINLAEQNLVALSLLGVI